MLQAINDVQKYCHLLDIPGVSDLNVSDAEIIVVKMMVTLKCHLSREQLYHLKRYEHKIRKNQ